MNTLKYITFAAMMLGAPQGAVAQESEDGAGSAVNGIGVQLPFTVAGTGSFSGCDVVVSLEYMLGNVASYQEGVQLLQQGEAAMRAALQRGTTNASVALAQEGMAFCNAVGEGHPLVAVYMEAALGEGVVQSVEAVPGIAQLGYPTAVIARNDVAGPPAMDI